MTDPLLGEAPPPVRELTGHTHAAVLPSGTAALAAALHALDVHGTEVDIPAIGCWTLTTAVWEAGGVPAYVDVDDTLQARRVSERPGIVIAPWGLVAAPGSCRPPTVLDTSVSLTRHQDPAAAITVISLGGGKPGAVSGGGGLLATSDPHLIDRLQQAAVHHHRGQQWLDLGPRIVAGPVPMSAVAERFGAIVSSWHDHVDRGRRARGAVNVGLGRWTVPMATQDAVASLLPVLLAEDYPLGASEVARVAAAHNLPLVRQPIGPPYLEPAFARRRPPHRAEGCEHAEELASRLLFVPANLDLLTAAMPALDRVLEVLAGQPAQFRAPYGLDSALGHDDALTAVAGYVARRLDGTFVVIDESRGRRLQVPRAVAATLILGPGR